MKTFALCFVMLLGTATMGRAKTTPIAIPGDDLGWSQPCPNCTIEDVQSMTFKGYVDGATTGTPLAGVVCTGAASPFTCAADFPALATGNHTIQVEPIIVSSTGATLVGEKSDAFAWRLLTGVPLKPESVGAVAGQD